MHLTKRIIDATKGDPEKEIRLWDDDPKGLFLRIRGESRTWWVQYGKGARGRVARVSIGPHGSPWTLDSVTGENSARAEARKLLGLAEKAKADGDPSLDPAVARRRRVKKTVEEWAREYVTHSAQTKKPRTIYEDRALLGLLPPSKRKVKDPRRKRTILAALGTLPLDLVTAQDIERLKTEWSDTPTRANRALALLSHLFSTAINLGHRKNQTNPVRGVKRYEEAKRKNRSTGESVYLTDDERARLDKALVTVEKTGNHSPHTIGAIRALALSGARASEILGLKWTDLETNVAALEDSKTGAKDLHLPPAAVAVLKKLPRVKGNDFVIIGGKKGEALTLWGLEQAWDHVRSLAGLKSVRLHDLRHSYASTVLKGGGSLLVVKELLGHADIRTTQRYAHVEADVLAEAAKKAGASIAASMKRAVKGTR